jgi:hypothetical protein
MYRFILFFTSALAGGEWSASLSGRLTPGEKAPPYPLNRGWMDPRAGQDDVDKRKFLTFPRLDLRPLGRPARSQSLCLLRYPVSLPNIMYYCILYVKLRNSWFIVP